MKADKGWLPISPVRTARYSAAFLPSLPFPPFRYLFEAVGKHLCHVRANRSAFGSAITGAAVTEGALETGFRPAEACRLRWCDVDFTAGVCTLGDHKTGHSTGRPRTVYLTPTVQAILEGQRERKESATWVFTNRLRQPHKPMGLLSMMRGAGREAPGAKVTTYQLRHSYAQMRRREVEPDVLMHLMGHADIGATLHYYRVEETAVHRLARGLAALVTPAPAAGVPCPAAFVYF